LERTRPIHQNVNEKLSTKSIKVKGKAIPLQGFRRLRLPDFKTIGI
jgi:hypothetical protein